MRLTIAIPTYNRKTDLTRVVSALVKNKPRENISLLIIDNASTVPAFEYISEIIKETGWPVCFIRNESNIGLSANLMRVLEYSQGDWIWTLGDDDEPIQGSLDLIMSEINKAKESVCLMKFSSTSAQVITDRQVSSLNQFCEYCAEAINFHNMLFMSTSVFSKKWVKKYINIGYHWGYSLGPQFAITMAALRDGAELTLHSNIIATSNHPDENNQWNKMRFILGLSVLGEIEGCDVFIKKTLRHYYCETTGIPWKWYITVHGPCLQDCSRSREYWRTYYMRLAGILPFGRAIYAAASAFTVPYLTSIYPVKRFFGWFVGSRNSISNADRS